VLNISYLIAQSRRDTNNRSEAIVVSDTEGIQDEDFIRYLNAGQERLQSVIVNRNFQAFDKISYIDTVQNQIEYSLPDDCYYKNKIVCLDYSNTGNLEDYYNLAQKQLKERGNLSSMYLQGYALRAGKVVLDPSPSISVTNGLRLTYVRRVSSLDIQRGIVSAVTLDTGTNTITSLTLDVSGTPPLSSKNISYLLEKQYLCVVDAYGNQKMIKVPVTAIDPNSGAVTIPSSFVFTTGETIAVGDYVCGGYRATTHSELSDECERYLIQYCNWRVQKRDSSQDAQETNQELKELENDIVESFADLNEDVEYIPMIDDSFIY
jgi:hypothetical protein